MGRESGLRLPRPGSILTLLISAPRGPGDCPLCSQPLTWREPDCLLSRFFFLLPVLEAAPLPSRFGLRGKEAGAGSGLAQLCQSPSCVRLFAIPWTVAHQAPPSMGFPRQEYWSGLPIHSLGDLPNPGIEPGSLTLLADALSSEPPGKPVAQLMQHLGPGWRHLPASPRLCGHEPPAHPLSAWQSLRGPESRWLGGMKCFPSFSVR